MILKYIADEIGITSGVFVDIGASDGISMSNSYLFRGESWEVFAFDGNYQNEYVQKLYCTPERIKLELTVGDTAFFDTHIDILSLDIDGQDYYILNAILETHRPSIIVCEVNGCIQQDAPVTVPLDDNFKHDGTDYYGANLPAFKKLLSDYTLVFHHRSQNAFFVHKSFNCPEFTGPMERMQYHPHDMQEREWINL